MSNKLKYSFQDLIQEDGSVVVIEEDLWAGNKTYTWEDIPTYIHTELVFGNGCGCGDIKGCLAYVLDALTTIDECSVIKDHEEREAKLREFFGTDRTALFFLYWADSRELTEHNLDISGSRLNDKGRSLLNDIGLYFTLNQE